MSKEAMIQHSASALLGVFFVMGLVVDRALGFSLFCLGLLGLLWLVAVRPKLERRPLDREERLLFFAFAFFVAVALISVLASGIHPRTISNIERYSRFLLLIPIYLLLRRTELRPGMLWVMVTIGAVVAGLVAVWHASTGRGDVGGVLHVSGGVGHHIHFGVGAVTLAFLSAASIGWFRRRHSILALLPVLALCMGLVASIASGSRGSWAGIPALILLAAVMPRTIFSLRLKATVAAAALALSVVAYLVPQTGVSGRVERAVSDVSEFFERDRRGTSVGARMEMWRTSSIMFMERPFIGHGVGGYGPTVNAMIEEDRASSSISHYDHPHNEYLNVLATRGLLGLLALGFLFMVPARRFFLASRDEDPDLRELGFGGLVVVVGFAVFGASDGLFERVFSIGFYTMAVAVLSALVAARKESLAARSASRRHPVSVVLIARDEADRIEEALLSVKGWADEIVVLDSGSTDETVEIARRHADRVEVTDWPGYSAQKERGARMARGPWVLSLDADERMTPALCLEIDRVLSEARPAHSAYRMPLTVEAFGGRMEFGRASYAPIRLFLGEGARFSGASVHETVVPTGSVGRLESRLRHVTHRDYHHAAAKLTHYAWLKAHDRFEAGARGGVVYGLMRALMELLFSYVVRLGFLDGRPGLLMAWLQARYVFDTQAGIWALRRASGKDESAGEGGEVGPLLRKTREGVGPP